MYIFAVPSAIIVFIMLFLWGYSIFYQFRGDKNMFGL